MYKAYKAEQGRDDLSMDVLLDAMQTSTTWLLSCSCTSGCAGPWLRLSKCDAAEKGTQWHTVAHSGSGS